MVLGIDGEYITALEIATFGVSLGDFDTDRFTIIGLGDGYLHGSDTIPMYVIGLLDIIPTILIPDGCLSIGLSQDVVLILPQNMWGLKVNMMIRG